MDNPRILILDIETSPNLAYCWGIWKENIGLDQLIKSSEILCWSAKWFGESKMHFASVYRWTRLDMMTELRDLLHEADVVVHYNGRKFDIPTINKDLARLEIAPPSPFKQVDLIEVSKHTFRFQSNRLEYVCRELGVGSKQKHTGFEMWKRCLENDGEAWALMEKYNKKDVLITEKLYKRMKPWMQNHPKLFTGLHTCPTCGSTKVWKHKARIAIKYKYQQYQCQACGHYFTAERVKI